MKKIKDVKEALMEALTNYVIAEKEEVCMEGDYYMGQVDAYLSVLDEYARLSSPWESLWSKVFVQSF